MLAAAEPPALHRGARPAMPAAGWPAMLLLAATGVALAWIAAEMLDSWLGLRGPMLLFTLPVLVSALHSGRGGAAVATGLALIPGALFVEEDGRLGKADVAYLLTFVAVAGGVILLGRRMQELHGRALLARDRAEADEARARDVAAALERRERHLRSILDTVPDAMVVIDARRRILSFSAAAEAMFGWTEAEMRGRNVATLMPGPDRERHDGYVARYLATGERRIIGVGRIVTARRRCGATFPIDLHIGEAVAGGERLFTGFIRDLSAQEEADRKLHALQGELAHMARLCAMGTLATSLAHELNQPLAAIANYAESARGLLARGGEGHAADLDEALAECAAQSLRAGRIVSRLRAFVAKGEPERGAHSLSRLVEEAVALAMLGAKADGVQLEVRLDPSADEVLVDRVGTQQVVFNLVRNAAEALRRSPLRRIRILSEREGDGSVRLSVEDSGPGLPDAVRARLFEPFNGDKPDGLGLGLSICRGIVDAQGGRMWADASALGGAAFRMTLPSVEDEHEA